MKIKSNRLFAFVMLLGLAAFVALKILRGMSTTESSGGIWNVIQLMFVGVGMLSSIVCVNSYRKYNSIVIFLFVMLWMWFLATIPFIMGKYTISTIFEYVTVPYGAMVVLAFFWVGKVSKIESFPWLVSISYYISAAMLFVFLRMFRMALSDEMGQLADVYYLLTLLPLMFIYSPKYLKLLPFVVACVVVMMTGKRAGFLALAVMMVIYFLLPDPSAKDKKMGKRVLIFSLMVVTMLTVIIILSDKFHLNMLDRLDTMAEDGGSGRVSRWRKLWRIQTTETNILQLFAGHGPRSVFKIFEGHAHNDFLELLYDYGIIAIVLYLLFYLALFFEGLKMFRAGYRYAREFMCAFVAAFFLAALSFFVIDSSYITCSGATIGLFMSDWDKYRMELKNGRIPEK